jgi:hypothetical protein
MTIVRDEFIDVFYKYKLFYVVRDYILYNTISPDYIITITNIPYISEYDTSVITDASIVIKIWYKNNNIRNFYIKSNNPTKQNIINAVQNILL